jgi:DNA invertase Pin-like site-specific DNA recombinase
LRAALYVRVSTDEQAIDGFSLDAQLNKLKSYCVLQEWEIAEVYREEGQSGRGTDRPQYKRMMSESDKWDVILVYKLDRIHRNSMNFAEMLKTLQDQGKEFCSVQDRFDTSTAVGRFARDVTERIAQLESEQTGERVKQAMDIKRAMGGIVSRLPFGYKIENGQATVDPDESYTVRAIFKMKDRGFSDSDIASYLDRANVPTSNGKRWSRSTIYNICVNPKYAGYDVRGGIFIQSNIPAIVERELYENINGPIGDRIRHR